MATGIDAVERAAEPTYFRFPDLTVCSVRLHDGSWIMWDWKGTSGWNGMTSDERDVVKEAERSAFQNGRRG